MNCQVFKPDLNWFQGQANKIARLSRIDKSLIERIEVNCGCGSYHGTVVLKNGDRKQI